MKTPALHLRRERGAALLETALALPMVLLVAVGIFEFGRAYQTWQVLTNAAREGARVAVLPGANDGIVAARAVSYMQAGQLREAANARIVVTPVMLNLGGGSTAAASSVTVNYPFAFIVLQPVANLIAGDSNLGAPITMQATSVMRIE
jgi:Flp pilus assembly protein TadG